MKFEKETLPVWNEEKEKAFDQSDSKSFTFYNMTLGAKINQEWWRATDDQDNLIGYGMIDETEEDFEISFLVLSEYQNKGYGDYIRLNLECIAKNRGYQVVKAVIKKENINISLVAAWLYGRGYVMKMGDIDLELKHLSSVGKVMNLILEKKIV